MTSVPNLEHVPTPDDDPLLPVSSSPLMDIFMAGLEQTDTSGEIPASENTLPTTDDPPARRA